MTPAVDLLSACPFAILAGTAITNIPPSAITGDVGLSPGTGAAIGVSCAEVVGNIYAVDAAGPLPCSIMDPVLLDQAKLDLVTAYDQGLALAPTMPIDTPIAGTLVPGVYPYSAAALVAAGVLNFDGIGDYVFQIPAGLTVPVGVVMNLINGADAKRIFWIVGSSAVINSGVTFKGSVLALTSISVDTLTNVEGKLLARNGAVTLDQNTVNSNSCFVICPDITLSSIPPTATIGIAYVGNTLASPAGIYTYSVTFGALPDGLNLNVNTGEITGIPILAGIFNFTIQAIDAQSCVGFREYTITVSPQSCPIITIIPVSIPFGRKNKLYNFQLKVDGGTPPYAFIIVDGELPIGLTLTPEGLIAGTPTVNGTYDFTVQVSDENFCVGAESFRIKISSGGWINRYCPCPY